MHYTFCATVHLLSPRSDRQGFYDRLTRLGLTKSTVVDTTWNGVTSGSLQGIELQIRWAAIMSFVGLDYQLAGDQGPIEGRYRPSLHLLLTHAGSGLAGSTGTRPLGARGALLSAFARLAKA